MTKHLQHGKKSSLTRNYYIDALKGGAILLVVLGHSIQTSVIAFDNNILFRLIYSFHMPLFMLLSGFILGFNRKVYEYKDLKKTSIRLLIPYIAWYIIAFIFLFDFQISSFLTYMSVLLKSPDAGLWFLWILFLEYFFFYIISQIIGYLKLNAYKNTLLLVTAIVIKFLPITVLAFNLFQWYFIFFVAGYVGGNYREIRYQKKTLQVLSLTIYLCLVFFWQRDGNSRFLPYLRENGNGLIQYLSLINTTYMIVVSFLGILSFTLIVDSIKRYSKKFYDFLLFLGAITLEIYVIQDFIFFRSRNFLQILNFSHISFIRIVIVFLIVLSVTIIFARVVHKNRLLSFILFGNRYKIVKKI